MAFLTRALTISLAAAALALAACDRTDKLEEGVSTEVEVRKQFGDPVTVTVNPGGTRTLDYPRQPEGWTNYVIQIGPDGKMSSLRQLLHPDNFARVKPGLRRDDVRQLLGRPAKMVRYDLKKEEVWDWRFKEGGQMSRLFSVTFNEAGVVTGSAVADDPRESLTGSR
jgi:outer membrane protein assembly factor BamE (lipoprotein component of BamABCDE complex)